MVVASGCLSRCPGGPAVPQCRDGTGRWPTPRGFQRRYPQSPQSRAAPPRAPLPLKQGLSARPLAQGSPCAGVPYAHPLLTKMCMRSVSSCRLMPPFICHLTVSPGLRAGPEKCLHGLLWGGCRPLWPAQSVQHPGKANFEISLFCVLPDFFLGPPPSGESPVAPVACFLRQEKGVRPQAPDRGMCCLTHMG